MTLLSEWRPGASQEAKWRQGARLHFYECDEKAPLPGMNLYL